MPDGRTHTMINAGVAGLVALGCVAAGVSLRQPALLAVLSGALIGTVFVTPDLDMVAVQTDSRRAWGGLGWIWWPLLVVSKHRGVSHSYLRGPVIRAAYLAVALYLLWTAVQWGTARLNLPPMSSWAGGLPFRPVLPVLTWPLCCWAYLGYWAAQVSHLLADRIPLTWQRL